MPNDNILDDFDFDSKVPPLWVEEGVEPPDWVGEGEVVAKFFSPLEAEFAAARLRSEGVICFLANTGIQSVLPQLQTVIRLHVRPEDSELALEILDKAASAATDDTTSNVSAVNNLNIILVFAIVIGILLAFLLVQSLSL
jgi:hypothetical protein